MAAFFFEVLSPLLLSNSIALAFRKAGSDVPLPPTDANRGGTSLQAFQPSVLGLTIIKYL